MGVNISWCLVATIKFMNYVTGLSLGIHHKVHCSVGKIDLLHASLHRLSRKNQYKWGAVGATNIIILASVEYQDECGKSYGDTGWRRPSAEKEKVVVRSFVGRFNWITGAFASCVIFHSLCHPVVDFSQSGKKTPPGARPEVGLLSLL
ncbi:uncharacterized protein LOC129749485 [Uranotaenia lowii]|uniref:uncharacterized protein LOC129749485 n=1 Tax=Uranotaenia lowii TaxID=190385 RepID=UPI00247841F6|nr:uncharacterized protein LOC129749485 [Uranotaenia lowii]